MITTILHSNYSLQEYETILPEIKQLTKHQLETISQSFWDKITPNQRFCIITHFNWYLVAIDYCKNDDYELDDDLPKIQHLTYQQLIKYKPTNKRFFNHKDLKEAIHLWLRIGDYCLSEGHINYYKNKQYPINNDRPHHQYYFDKK